MSCVRCLAVVLALLAISPARAFDDRLVFSKLNDAARGALSLAIGATTDAEFGGAIYQCGEAFSFSIPRSSGGGYSVTLKLKIPPTCALAAIYHTHPAGYLSERFSPEDLRVACGLGVPSFIQTPEHEPRVLIPSQRACRDLSRAKRNPVTADVLRGDRFQMFPQRQKL